MAPGTQSDWILYDEIIWDLFTEILEQNSDAFNAASNGALQLFSAFSRGEFERQSFFPQLDMVAHRDPNDMSDATDISLGMGEIVYPIVNRIIGPVADTKSRWRVRGRNPDEMNNWLAEQLAAELPIDFLNTLLASLVAALTAGGATTGDGSAQITSLLIEDLKQVMGDRKQRIRILVMSSLVHTALIKDQQTKQIYTTDGASIYQGVPATGGLPVLVTDSPALEDATPSPDHERVLALTEGAGAIAQTQDRELYMDTITGKAGGLVQRLQGEHAFRVRVKGYAWDDTVANPTNAQLGTSGNWTGVFGDVKSGPGAMLIVEKPGGTG